MTNVLSRLRLMHKLVLMIGLALAAVCTLLALDVWDSVQRVRAVDAARAGLEPSRALLQLVQLTQQHRGLTANVLGGRADAEPQRAAKQQEVDAALQRVQVLLDGGVSAARVLADRRDRQAEWQTLAQAVAGRQLAPAQSLARHGALIAGWLELHDRVLEHFGLTLDAEPTSHFLALAMLQDNPRMTELMGQARARGTGLLARQQATPEERAALAALLERVRALQRQMQVSLEKAFEADASLKAALGAELERTQAQVQAMLELARTQVLEAAELKLAPGDYFKQTTTSIDAAFALKDLAMKSLDAQLEQRRSALLRSDVLRVGACVLLMLATLAVGVATMRSIVASVHAARDAARHIAAGDLCFAVDVSGRDELGELQQAMRDMRDGLARVVGQVRQSAESVATASAQIAQGNNDLSQRTEQQAASLQTTASTMDELGATVRNNADHARQANQLAQGASDVAQRGGAVVQEVVHTMSGISESSRKIADIIGTIDGIAFQTNILALNAAVEAARAGEQGRGFAVVAGEVRALAGRSAEAAREIKHLIGASVERVEQGAAQVDEAGRTMQEVVSSIRRVSDIVGEISASSAEQDSGVHQVGEAVTQMDRATQQNAALVEQSAAAADSLRQQAEGLVQVVSVFRLA